MKHTAWIRAALVFVAAALCVSPLFAAPSIAVTPPGGGLNGTNHSLEVTFDGLGGEAVVISDHPNNEQTFNVSWYFDPNGVTLCNAINCRLFFLRAWGNREGPIRDAFQVGLRLTNFGYRIVLWYRDRDSVNPGQWEQISGPFINDDEVKLTVEWTAASAAGVNDGSVRLLTNDVLLQPTHEVMGVNNALEVDLVRMGHTNGAVRTGALGSFFLDEYVSTR